MMEREEITVRFADLRRAVETVPAYVQELSGVGEPLTLRTAIEDDLGMIGLDTEELLRTFGQQFRVDLTRFDFTGLISPEPGGNPLVVLLLLLYVALWLLAWVANGIAALCWAPFSLVRARRMLQAGIGALPPVVQSLSPAARPWPTAQVLTVGDLVASAATGYFVKRERVRFVLAA
ncbi:MAG: hypothetical protein JWP58_41 [Hymenobacter sp.]|nr:hypothetical protein [Hymenobacter sp.]